MRKLTAGLFHSVDGAVEAPNVWQFDSFDAELDAMLGAVMTKTDTVILGRVGYQEWSGFWPNAGPDMEFADFINTVPKFVASRTLTGPLAWRNSTLIEGELEDFVRKVKNQEGGDVALMAGISLGSCHPPRQSAHQCRDHGMDFEHHPGRLGSHKGRLVELAREQISGRICRRGLPRPRRARRSRHPGLTSSPADGWARPPNARRS